MVLKRFAYVPHDGLAGITFPDAFFDDQTGEFVFGDGVTPRNLTINGDLIVNGSLSRARAQMDNCGTQNLNGVSEGNPLPMPFSSSVSDAPLLSIVGPGVIQVEVEGIYLLSYNLAFESDTIVILQGSSLGACWQWAMDPQGPWSDLIMTKTFDTVHGVADDHGSLSLPPVEQQLAAGTLLRVVGFQLGTSIDVYVNSNDNQGGPFNWSWARVEAFRVSVAPPPP